MFLYLTKVQIEVLVNLLSMSSNKILVGKQITTTILQALNFNTVEAQNFNSTLQYLMRDLVRSYGRN